MTRRSAASGFSLIELLMVMLLLLIVSSVVTTALLQMTNSQKTIWGRTQMHSGIRGATELLQQEIGQAGRISLPNPDTPVTLTGGVAGVLPCATPVTVSVSSSAGMFVTESLTTMDAEAQESVSITAIPSATEITACFTRTHVAGARLLPLGGFATGVIPNTGIPNQSSDIRLKMYGDINSDGNMVYVEYWCDYTSGNLYRSVIPLDSTDLKTQPSPSQILLGNIVPNPKDPADPTKPPKPCFDYQVSPVLVGGITTFTFVLDVAVTLTVETEEFDPITKKKGQETKALLNVAPRNVFSTWEFAGLGYTDRIQSTPTRVMALLPEVP